MHNRLWWVDTNSATALSRRTGDVRPGDSRHLRLVSRVRADPSPSDGLLEGPVDDHVRSSDRRRRQRLGIPTTPLAQLPVELVDVFRP